MNKLITARPPWSHGFCQNSSFHMSFPFLSLSMCTWKRGARGLECWGLSKALSQALLSTPNFILWSGLRKLAHLCRDGGLDALL